MKDYLVLQTLPAPLFSPREVWTGWLASFFVLATVQHVRKQVHSQVTAQAKHAASGTALAAHLLA